MQPRWLAAVGASAIAIVVGITAADASSCIRNDERTAFQVRALQTELMVAALSCNAHQEYNAFVTRFKSALNKHGHTMNGYFSRAFGQAGEREATRYTTGVANRSALASTTDMNMFCDTSITTLHDVLQVAAKDFEGFMLGRKAFASDFGPAASAQVCTAAATKPTS